MRLGVRMQLLLAFTALLIVGGIGATLLLYHWLAEELEEVVTRQGTALARNIAKWSEESVLTENRVNLLRLVTEMKASNDEVIYVYFHDPQDRVLAHSFDGGFPAALAEATAGRRKTLLKTERGSVVDVTASILGGQGGEVHVGYSRRGLLASVNRLKMMVWLIAVPMFLLGFLAVSILSGFLTRPARLLTSAVRRLGTGDLSARVEHEFSGEFGTLARSFDTMAENLERQANELRYLTEYNQNLIDNLGAGLYVVDENLTVEYANRVIRDELGEVQGTDCHEVLCRNETHCSQCVAEEARAAEEVRSRTCMMDDGRWLEQTAIPVHNPDGTVSTVVTRRDITEAVRLREQMTQAEKLGAVGELAAVVAHEVNNPLDGMQSMIRLVVDGPEIGTEARDHLKMVQEGLFRLEMIVRRLLTFTADSAEPSRTSTLEDEVNQALAFTGRRLSGAGVEVRTEFAEGTPAVRIDPNRFPQVLVNLTLNAADAMPDGGALTIRTERRGSGVVMIFEDEGIGVPPELRERIFQPFFTTKEPGKGTGLGLAVCRRIVHAHGGTLAVRDATAGGAAFDLWLPGDSAESPAPEEVRG